MGLKSSGWGFSLPGRKNRPDGLEHASREAMHRAMPFSGSCAKSAPAIAHSKPGGAPLQIERLWWP